ILSGKFHATARIGVANHELISLVRWVGDDRLVIATARYYGGFDRPAQDGKLISVTADGGEAHNLLGPHSGGHIGSHIHGNASQNAVFFGRLLSTLPEEPNQILVKGWHRGSQLPAAYIVDVRTGTRHRIMNGLSGGDFLVDHSGKIRLEWGYSEKTGAPIIQFKGTGDTKNPSGHDLDSLAQLASGLSNGNPVMFGPENHILYYRAPSPATTGTQALYSYNLKTGKNRLLYASPNADVGEVIESFSQDTPVGLRIY